MKKVGLILGIILLMGFIPLAFAANLEVTKIDKGSVIISELNNPAVFDFVINNKGPEDTFEIYSLLGIPFSPKGTFDLPTGSTTIPVKVYPNKELRRNYGFYTFEYQIKGQNTGIFKDKLTIKIVNLEDALEVSGQNFKPGDKELSVDLINLENTNFEDMQVHLKSTFFDFSDKVSLTPFGKKTLKIPVNLDSLKGLNAGHYVITAEIVLGTAKTRLGGTINYLEKEGLSVNEVSNGILMRSTTVTKENEGNIPVIAKIQINKDIFSRLLTVYSIPPTTTERKGFSVDYIWEKNIKPSESFEVTATTNYTFPFILLILIVIVALVAQRFYQTSLSLNKRVSFVKTRGGEFALKVTIRVKAQKRAHNIQIIDRLPGSTQLYEKFGIRPSKIDSTTRRLIWEIPNLNAGEERVFSYVIYSKLKIMGRFELPPATAIFEREDKTHEVFSNKTYFMNDMNSTE